MVTFGDAEARIPPGWKGSGQVDLVVDASHPDAQPGDVLLVGQNEKTPTVVQDMAGIRVVRFRPGDAREPAPETQASCLCSGVPIAKRETVVLSHEVRGHVAALDRGRPEGGVPGRGSVVAALLREPVRG